MSPPILMSTSQLHLFGSNASERRIANSHRPLATPALSFKSCTVISSQNGKPCPPCRTQLGPYRLIAQPQAGQTTLYKQVHPDPRQGGNEAKTNDNLLVSSSAATTPCWVLSSPVPSASRCAHPRLDPTRTRQRDAQETDEADETAPGPTMSQ